MKRGIRYALLGYRVRYTAGILRRYVNTKHKLDSKDIQRGLKLPPNEQRIYYGKYLHQLKAQKSGSIPHKQMVSTVNQLMVKFYRLGMYQSARDAFATLSYPSLQSYLIVAPCMAHILSFEEMLSFVDDCMRRTRSVHLDLGIFNSLLTCQVKRAYPPLDLQSLLALAAKYRVTPDIVSYNVLIDYYCRYDQIKQAEDLLTRLHEEGNVAPDVMSYSPLIHTLTKKGNRMEAIDQYHCMKERGIKPDVDLYHYYAMLQAAVGNLSEVEKLMVTIDHAGTPPPEPTIRAVCAGLAMRMRKQKVERYLDILLTHASSVESAIRHLLCITTSLGGLEATLLLLRKLQERDRIPRADTLNEIVRLVNRRDKKKLGTLFTLYDQHGIELDSHAIAIRMNAYIDSGKVALAEQLFSSTSQRSTDMYNALLRTEALRKYGKGKAAIDRSLALIQELEKEAICKPDVVTLNEMIKASISNGASSDLMAVLEQKLRSWTQVKPSRNTFRMIVKFYARKKDREQCKRWLDIAETYGFGNDVYIYTSLLSTYTYGGKSAIPEMRKILSNMKEKDIQPTEVTMRVFVRALLNAGYTREAILYVQGFKAHSSIGVDTYTMLIEAMAKLGLYQEAAEHFSDITKAGLLPTPASIHAMCRAYMRAGKHDYAAAFLSQVLRTHSHSLPEVDPRTFDMVMQQCMREGEREMKESIHVLKEQYLKKREGSLLGV